MAKKEKTSLEKSHSTWSNTKLTSLCVFTVLFVSLFWLSLGLYPKIADMINTVVAIACIAVSAVLSILCLIGFNKFTR